MARMISIIPHKTYKTKENAEEAVCRLNIPDEVRYIIVCDHDGRYYPIFIGELAIQYGVHWHFAVVG